MATHLSATGAENGPRPLVEVLEESDRATEPKRVMPTGFNPLDRVLDGGLHTRNLTVVAGSPGAGKTITCLQWARDLAHDGHRVIYACYEHDETTLLTRLLRLEMGEIPADERLGEQGLVAKSVLKRLGAGEVRMSEALQESDMLHRAYLSMQSYANDLWLLAASGTTTTVETLIAMVGSDTDALFVDYIQKVPLDEGYRDEAEGVTVVTQALKELAMAKNIAVVAIAASTRSGLEAHRLRIHHLRGSSAVAYEADVVLVLNDKFDVVSKSQMAHDMGNVERFKNQLVFSVEKNRDGEDNVDLEFDKLFDYMRVDPEGATVQDRLIDDHLVTE